MLMSYLQNMNLSGLIYVDLLVRAKITKEREDLAENKSNAINTLRRQQNRNKLIGEHYQIAMQQNEIALEQSQIALFSCRDDKTR
ncbi:unnamed protein product [Peronospora farinosa]|uniref:Uncharacterized protein n=1 Tax=Peronospora farinosa TaxID=134698 RepID=A0AAV0SQD0_9STRA|nr:unnamed protein product [Peronospora farinosa]CAI5705774.1 unnamed protein product [Peronospora farinosa]